MDLSDWRTRIDDLDRKILALVNERARCVLELAPLKRQMHIPVHEPRREQAVLSNLRAHNTGPLSDEAVRQIFESIMQQMRAVQKAQAGRTRGASKAAIEGAPAGQASRKHSREQPE